MSTASPPVHDDLRWFPGSRRLLMHPAAGRRARLVRALAGTSDWRREVLDRLGAGLVAVTGPRRWPSAPDGWPWPAADAETIASELRAALPGLRVIGAAVPRQDGRERLSLLCRHAGCLIVVKLGVDSPTSSLRTEADVLGRLMARPLPGIETPDVLATGSLTTDRPDRPVRFLATSTLSLGTQRPAIDVALRTFEADLTARLAHGSATPDGQVAVHGDLTPWNLRRTPRGLALFDWEHAGWADPGTDIDHYRAACDEVRPWWRRRPA